MGAINGLLGIAGGVNGTGQSGPVGANISNPTSQTQVNNSYNQVQNLLSALQSQNGIGNQNHVYSQLQGVANGTGPNPAQAQLAQATGANVANQAALMAGQRGSSSNVGLMARQNAQQGAATQQQSAGQAASMQAQQSLNAIGAAGNMANQQAQQQIGATQNEQASLLNAMTGYQGQQVGMQSNINNVNGQLANTTMQGQQAMIGGLMSAIGSGSSMMGGMSGGARGGMVQRFDDGGPVASADSDVPDTSTPSFGADAGASALAKGFGSLGGGGSSSGGGSSGGGGSSMMSMLPMLAMMAADGGQVPQMPMPQLTAPQSAVTGPQSAFGQFLAVGTGSSIDTSTPGFGADSGAKALQQGTKDAAKKAMSSSSNPMAGATNDVDGGDQYAGADPSDMDQTQMTAAKGGMVDALVSPGEIFLKPKDVKKVAKGASPQKVGEKIHGKPKVGGAKNSYANDTVPKKLEVGGIVVPRSETMSKNPERNSAAFVAKVLAKRKRK